MTKNNWDLGKEPREGFKSTPYQCPECESIIQSSYPGEWVSCECGKCFVDQTRHYIRVGGPAKPLKKKDDYSALGSQGI